LKSAPGALYLDASALVKLVIRESESAALRRFLKRNGPVYSSRIAMVEVPRAVSRQRERDAARQVDAVLGGVRWIELDEAMADAAASTPPPGLRTLDAIHVAAALALGEVLTAVVAYDARLADAARAAGLHVAAPS
jgi:predicted nucleic acid-binding protein